MPKQEICQQTPEVCLMISSPNSGGGLEILQVNSNLPHKKGIQHR